jgi:hypothetical protein
MEVAVVCMLLQHHAAAENLSFMYKKAEQVKKTATVNARESNYSRSNVQISGIAAHSCCYLQAIMFLVPVNRPLNQHYCPEGLKLTVEAVLVIVIVVWT